MRYVEAEMAGTGMGLAVCLLFSGSVYMICESECVEGELHWRSVCGWSMAMMRGVEMANFEWEREVVNRARNGLRMSVGNIWDIIKKVW